MSKESVSHKRETKKQQEKFKIWQRTTRVGMGFWVKGCAQPQTTTHTTLSLFFHPSGQKEFKNHKRLLCERKDPFFA